MTTDVAEKTELEGQAAEGDAGAQSAADAAAASQEVQAEAESGPVDLESARAAYFEEVDGKESGEGVPESNEARVARQQQFETDRATLRANHRSRHEKVDGLKGQLLTAGLSEIEAAFFLKEAKDRLTEEHADALKLGPGEAVLALSDQVWGAVYSALPKETHADLDKHFAKVSDENGGVVPYSEMYKAVADFSRRGYTQEKDAKKAREKAFDAGFAAGRSAGEDAQNGASSGNVPRGAGAQGAYTLQQWNSMTLELREAARRKDPNIEDKIR